jgi:hypothetical protein
MVPFFVHISYVGYNIILMIVNFLDILTDILHILLSLRVVLDQYLGIVIFPLIWNSQERLMLQPVTLPNLLVKDLPRQIAPNFVYVLLR